MLIAFQEGSYENSKVFTYRTLPGRDSVPKQTVHHFYRADNRIGHGVHANRSRLCDCKHIETPSTERELWSGKNQNQTLEVPNVSGNE
jgi:hypothetical protein